VWVGVCVCVGGGSTERCHCLHMVVKVEVTARRCRVVVVGKVAPLSDGTRAHLQRLYSQPLTLQCQRLSLPLIHIRTRHPQDIWKDFVRLAKPRARKTAPPPSPSSSDAKSDVLPSDAMSDDSGPGPDPSDDGERTPSDPLQRRASTDSGAVGDPLLRGYVCTAFALPHVHPCQARAHISSMY
jgi:hypothetical protein